ncbi:helix-turn-helix domain-containing protein [Saccharibacillus sp. CPCC 101409]|uniref:helix-turn-helix domain-containing protein n=1 Tax=Saccharibacillus sp. CPCC 101409 TaxID=3058041 RepID=UPI00267242FA|nr:helix-turn-helix domain-containing protein [Saccharibacillus sp. CPCC 101409]MDO3411325.1 helix-turn-helix domain-containing protein [Saccharibacillus sp. CPCC 101409]
MINYFEYQDSIAKNLLDFIRLNGYSKLSFSKLTGISRPTIDRILRAESPNPTVYNDQIDRINTAFNLNEKYFLTAQTSAFYSSAPAYAFSDHGTQVERSWQAGELLDGLDNMLDIFSMHMK